MAASDIADISGFLQQTEELIRDVKTNKVDTTTARTIIKLRALQLQAAGLNLSYQRLISRFPQQATKNMPMLAGGNKPTGTVQQPTLRRVGRPRKNPVPNFMRRTA